MKNIIIGLVVVGINVLSISLNGFSWWGVLGVAMGSVLMGFGLREALQ